MIKKNESKSLPAMSEIIHKACNSLTSSRAMKKLSKVNFKDSLSIMVMTMNKTRYMFKMMAIMWDHEPGPSNGPFLCF